MFKKFLNCFKYLWMSIKRFMIHAHKSQTFDNGEHLYDQIVAAQDGTWMNIHGYLVNGTTYYVCADVRWIGIRIENILVECHTKSSYDKWIEITHTHSTSYLEEVKRSLPYKDGDAVDTCYIFNTTDGKHKEYNVDQWQDVYAVAD